MEKIFTISKKEEGERLDVFMRSRIAALSRTKIHALIESGNIRVNGLTKKPSYRLKDNDTVAIRFEEEKVSLQPFDFSVKIIYEDTDILVVDKPCGLVVHPPRLGYHESLVNALLYMKKELSSIDPLRRGIVHRLDKETSGLMVVAKNNLSHLSLCEQFKERRVKKEYLAISWGLLAKEHLTVDMPLRRDAKNRLKMRIGFIQAKRAHTDIEVVERYRDSTLLRLRPLTGRMHQIRVHLKFLGYPIVGDKKYGIRDNYESLFLHAHRLGFYHPQRDNFVEFVSEIPQRFREFIDKHR